jgi:aspartyl-tRNA synthetase
MLYLSLSGTRTSLPLGATAQVVHKSPLFTDGLEDSFSLPFEVPTRGNELALQHTHELPLRHRVVRWENSMLGHAGLPLHPGTAHLLSTTPHAARLTFSLEGFVERVKGMLLPDTLREEDTRGDRQPEFTQLDLEMSFPTQEDIIRLNEEMLIKIVQTIYPEKRIQSIPFPRLTHAEAMAKYNSDKPDIRENKEDPNLLAFCWVVDFPMFEKTDTGAWTFTHNPFSGVQAKHEADLMAERNIEKIIATQYDVTLNGHEIGGGSVRNHKPEALKKVFQIMGYSDERIEANFGHMLKALGSGTPPHGGIAWGLDRLMMILENEPNIREVIAFAKTGEGRDLMMESPSNISDEQLMELGIEVKEGK